MFKPNKNQLLGGTAVVAVVIVAVLLFANSTLPGADKLSFLTLHIYSKDKIAKKSIDYLNANVLQQGQSAQLVSSSEESGVVKLKIKIGTNTYDSYATKDGKLLFPEAFTLDKTTNQAAQNTQNAPQVTPENVAKVNVTALDVYVVSRCPYGLQIQRAIANAVSSIPSLAQYIKIRYIGAISGNTITSMHGDAEAKENLRQICLREEQPTKYWPYVACQMKDGNTTACQASTGVDASKLNACVADSQRGLAYAAQDFQLQGKYNVQGSPTLVLNGTTISEDAFGGRSAESMKNIICSSSKTAPAFCSTKLNTQAASTSFSLTYTGSGTAATSNGTNCAPATVQ